MKALRLAAFEGNFIELKRICREVGAKVNEAGPETGRTALHWGAFGGHSKVVSYLLKAAGAKVDPLDNELETPLNFVIPASHLPLSKKLDVIGILLAHEANPRCANKQGETPLNKLEILRDNIPNTHYFQLRGLDSLIQKIKERISKNTFISLPGDELFASRLKAATQQASNGRLRGASRY